MVLRYSPEFYPFSDPSPGTHPGPSPILARIPPFLVLARTFLRYSPGFHLSLVLTQIFTFLALAWILPFSGPRLDFYFFSTRPNSTLSRYSPEPFSGTHPNFYFSGTRPDSTLSRYSPGPFSGTRPDFHLSETHPDPTFSGTCLDFYFSGTRPDSTLSQYSPGPFSSTHSNQSPMFRILRYLLGFDPFCSRFFGTCSDSILFVLGSPILARIDPLLFRWFSDVTLESSSPYV